MLLEYRLPLTSQRADVVFAGVHPSTGEPSYVVVELKQWSSAFRFEDSTDLVSVPGMPGPPKLHPVAQVRGFCDYIADFARFIADRPDSLAGIAYLHNATDTARISEIRAFPDSTTGRLFTAAEKSRMIEFLRLRLASQPGAPAADLLLQSAFTPSQQLLKFAADEIRERPQFQGAPKTPGC